MSKPVLSAIRLLAIAVSVVVGASVLLALPASPVSAAPPKCDGRTATIYTSTGTKDGFNVFQGTSGADVIYGSNGQDRILGSGGNDIICGQGGNDEILGGYGADKILAGGGADVVHGQQGNDLLYGGEGNDKLLGGDHQDKLYGANGNDNLNGGNGTDLLDGGGWNFDVCVDPQASGTTKTGCESARPQPTTPTAARPVVTQPPTTQRPATTRPATTTRPQPVTAKPKCEGLTATIVGTPNADGSAVTIAGTSAMDIIVGTSGRDIINGFGGNDVICGLAGDDLIYGNGGNDDLYGGPGNDNLLGGENDDDLYGGDGNDNLYGEAGNDTLWGGSNTDLLSGGVGQDRMFGQRGVDTYKPGSGSSDRCEDEDQILDPGLCNLVTGQGDNVVFTDATCSNNSGVIGAKIVNDQGATRNYELRAFDGKTTRKQSNQVRHGSGQWMHLGLPDGVYQVSMYRLGLLGGGTTVASKRIVVDCVPDKIATPIRKPRPKPAPAPPHCKGAQDKVAGLNCTDFITKVWAGPVPGDRNGLEFSVTVSSTIDNLRYEIELEVFACDPENPRDCTMGFSSDAAFGNPYPIVIAGPVVHTQTKNCVDPLWSENFGRYTCELDGKSLTFPGLDRDMCGAVANVKIFNRNNVLLYTSQLASRSIICNPYGVPAHGGRSQSTGAELSAARVAPDPISANRSQSSPETKMSYAELVIPERKASNQDGFVLYSDGTRQWINADCYRQLTNSGTSSRLVDYTKDIVPLTNRPGKNTCDELKALL